jgi:capsule polysaccharide export protein KpsE/RkpR
MSSAADIIKSAEKLEAIKPSTQILVSAYDYESLVLAAQLCEVTLEAAATALEAIRTTLAQVRR